MFGKSSSARILIAAATVLAFAVVVLGAYVRLKDAGLGCPDWPGCYGQLIGVPDASESGEPIDQARAWIEVSHRYMAAFLGLLVLAAAITAFVRPATGAERTLVGGLLVLVIGQGLLGALTVTEKLMPAIVSSHLLGGMLILGLLAACCAHFFAPDQGARRTSSTVLRAALVITVVAVFMQLALGVWVSANYAGFACGAEYPLCNGSWLPHSNADALALNRELGFTAAGEPLTAPALVAVQLLHRLGALILVAAVAVLSWLLFAGGFRATAVALAVVLTVQFVLGVLTVMSELSLSVALLHNAGAAALVAVLAASAAQVLLRPSSPEVQQS